MLWRLMLTAALAAWRALNAGHCLFSGIALREAAHRCVAQTLLDKTSYSGLG